MSGPGSGVKVRLRFIGFWILASAAALLMWAPDALAAQALIGTVGFGGSGYETLGSPIVVGAEIRSPSLAGVYLRIGARRTWDRSTADGMTCDLGWPVYEGCRNERVRTDLTMHSRWYGLGYQLVHGVHSFECGIRRVRHELDPEVRGLRTGRSDLNWIPTDPIERWGFDVGVSRFLGSSRHWGLKLVYSVDPTDFQGCATDVGTPYCGGATIHTVSVGLALAR